MAQTRSEHENKELIDGLKYKLDQILHNSTLAGVFLLFTTIVAIVWANSPIGHTYDQFWHIYLKISFGDFELKYSLQHWINDLLMAIFFFFVGLEIKREVIAGELSSFSKALLPVAAAIGGMVVPALIFVIFNYDTPSIRGWGIPMATDIAFALGVLSLFGSRVPVALKVFLAALAIADDIGAVLVIALFYSSGVDINQIVYGFGFLAVLAFFNFIGVRSALVYALVGFCGLWLSFLLSGVHPSVAGVLAAFTIPARSKLNAKAFLLVVRPYLKLFEEKFQENLPGKPSPFLNHGQIKTLSQLETATMAATPPLQRLEEQLHPWVSFFIMPVFALANAGVRIDPAAISELASPISLGIILGLFLGKQLGVFAFTYAVVKAGLTSLPSGVNWKMIYAASCLAGIGFTMSLFISALAFKGDSSTLEAAKLAILVGSLFSATVGCIVLSRLCAKGKN